LTFAGNSGFSAARGRLFRVVGFHFAMPSVDPILAMTVRPARSGAASARVTGMPKTTTGTMTTAKAVG